MLKHPSSVLIAEDHFILNDGLVSMLAEYWPQTTFYQAWDGLQILEHFKSHLTEFILLDIEMPRLTGLEALKVIRNSNLPRQPKVLVMSSHVGYGSVMNAIQCGANGFTDKYTPLKELTEITSEILNGGTYIKPELIEAFSKYPIELSGTPIIPAESLTPKEITIIRLICQGQSSKQIAAETKISFKTVLRHRENLRKKIQVKNVSELVSYALINQLIDPSDLNERNSRVQIGDEGY